MQDQPKDTPAPKEQPKDTPGEKSSSAPSQADTMKMAQELGMAKKENETLKDYQERVNPVIETIWSDPDLLKQVEDRHKKRLNPTKEVVKDTPEDKSTSSPVDIDTRNAVIRDIVDKFSDRYGITKLDTEKKAEMNTKVGTMLKDMLDPNGNKKDLADVMKDVSLTKLPSFLDHAYFLSNKESMLSDAKEQGKRELQDASLGVVGSFSSTSIEPDSMTLSPREKQIAENMGIPPDKYLARKKEIAKRNNELV